MGVQVCERNDQKKMELNVNIQLVMNSFWTLYPDKIFSPTFPGFPDKWSPCSRNSKYFGLALEKSENSRNPLIYRHNPLTP